MKRFIIQLFILSTSLVPLSSFAGKNCSNRPDQLAHLSDMQKVICQKAIDAGYSGQELGCYKTGGLSVAWYQDRDNSMSPARDKAGRAMGIVRTLTGYTQSVQVCPGVYRATAHGALDNPLAAKAEGRKHRKPTENNFLVSAYPLSKENVMGASTNAQFISPRRDDPSLWDEKNPNHASSDYVFIKVDKAKRPNDFIPLVQAAPEDFIDAANLNKVDVHLYRGLTRFNKDERGNPDYNDKTWKKKSTDMKKLYSEPQRVNQECALDSDPAAGHISTNCPIERSVSGSPFILEKNGQQYFMGGASLSTESAIEEYTEHTNGSALLGVSDQECKHYQEACGEEYKCNSLKEILRKNVSI